MTGRRDQTSFDSVDTDFVSDGCTCQKLLENLSLSATSENILRVHLSIRSIVSTTSSFAKRQQATSESLETQEFRLIGAGTCGRVYEQPGSPLVIKREKDHNFIGRGLLNDFNMHQRIYNAFQDIAARNAKTFDVHIPKPETFIAAADPWWNGMNLELFESGDRKRSNLLMMERILLIPKPIREALIDQFCAPELRDSVKSSRQDADCLIRPYLGKSKEKYRLKPRFFTLRNFSMHYDQFEGLGLEDTMRGLAAAMAEALAVMHWECQVDANDVEFVLGSAPTFKDIPHRFSKGYNCESREVHFWLLDFNQVQGISMDDKGIDMATRAFRDNDKYYPRPGRGPEWLCELFKERYLATSHDILCHHRDRFPHGPENFITGVETMQA